MSNGILDFAIGGVSACGAGLFTNPLEVAKTRMQLQGELKAKGKYTIHYKNVFHAFYTVARTDGILALQKGLIPASCYQLVMNGIRLGVFETIDNLGFIRVNGDQVSLPRSIVAGGFSGCIGALVGSPFYLMKIQFQSMAAREIAVGHQHSHLGIRHAFNSIYTQYGISGLWRGAPSAMTRVMVGSAAQLTTFSWCRQRIVDAKLFNSCNDWRNGLLASMASGTTVVFVITPFDVVSTRIYNQGVCPQGKGLLYSGIIDCFMKIYKTEGLWGFYKGWSASWFRSGPHTVLTLFFWDRLKQLRTTVNLQPEIS